MRTYNIPIFVPHKGCPYDCVFCNQKRITGEQKDVTEDDVRFIIEKHLKTLPKMTDMSKQLFLAAVLPEYRLKSRQAC